MWKLKYPLQPLISLIILIPLITLIYYLLFSMIIIPGHSNLYASGCQVADVKIVA